MPKSTNDLKVNIKRLSKEKYSNSQIKTKLNDEGHDASIATICRVLKNTGIRGNQSRPNEAEHKNQIKERANCRKLYRNHLVGNKSEYVVVLDEALIYENDSAKKESNYCYVKEGEEVPKDWLIKKDQSGQASCMVIGIITGRGVLPLLRVPSEVKMNADYYVENVLKPLFSQHLPSLYPGEMKKVFFFHDKTSHHIDTVTTNYLNGVKQKLGISFIDKESIPVRCKSPLNYFVYGYLKMELQNRRATTLNGVWKLSHEIWSKIDLEMIENEFTNWKSKLRMRSTVN